MSYSRLKDDAKSGSRRRIVFRTPDQADSNEVLSHRAEPIFRNIYEVHASLIRELRECFEFEQTDGAVTTPTRICSLRSRFV